MRKGTQVTWKYGTGTGTGKVESIHNDSISKLIMGSNITRNGSDENPALLIVQEDGGTVLKLQSEVEEVK